MRKFLANESNTEYDEGMEASVHHKCHVGQFVVGYWPGGSVAGPFQVVSVNGDYVTLTAGTTEVEVDAAQCVLKPF